MVTLSRPLRAAVPRMIPNRTPGFCSTGNTGPASFDHFLSAGQESAHVQTHERAGHHAKIRERGITPADAGQAGKNMAEAIGLGDLLHLRAGVGDGDEAAAGFVRADGLLRPFEEILLENIGLERGAGLAGDDEQRLGQVDLVLDRLDLRRIGGIEHMQLRKARDLAEGHCQHVGAQTGAAHAQQQDVGEVFLLYVGHGGTQLIAVGDLLGGDVEPAHPVGFVRAGPERSVVLPEAADLVARSPIFNVRLYRGRQGLG